MTQVNQPHNNVHCRNNQINFLNTIIYILKGKRPVIKERTKGVDILGNTLFLIGKYQPRNYIIKAKNSAI